MQLAFPLHLRIAALVVLGWTATSSLGQEADWDRPAVSPTAALLSRGTMFASRQPSQAEPVPSLAMEHLPADSNSLLIDQGLIQPLEPKPVSSYGWQLLPAGLMYHSYLAGPKEPRINAVWLRDRKGKLDWETQLGGRLGLIRYGEYTAINPNGWQLDFEGGAQARVLPENNSDLEACDYRIGILLTRRQGVWAWKGGYYHLSSHVGDEFLISNPSFTRLNYVRDSLIMGLSRDLLINGRADARVYGEYANAIGHEVAKPNEFQFGAEYSPLVFNGIRGTPFAGINGSARQDRNWDATSLSLAVGWQWRSPTTNQRLRLGVQYHDGDSLQYSFPGQKQSSMGWGMWIDY